MRGVQRAVSEGRLGGSQASSEAHSMNAPLDVVIVSIITSEMMTTYSVRVYQICNSAQPLPLPGHVLFCPLPLVTLPCPASLPQNRTLITRLAPPTPPTPHTTHNNNRIPGQGPVPPGPIHAHQRPNRRLRRHPARRIHRLRFNVCSGPASAVQRGLDASGAATHRSRHGAG